MAAESPRPAFDFRSPVRACADQLDEVLAASRSRISRWRKERSQAFHFEVQRGLQDLRRERQALEDLRADLAGIEELTEAAAKLRDDGVRISEVVQLSVDAAAKRAEAALRAKARLEEAHELRRQDLRREEAALAERRREAEAQAAAVDGLFTWYRDRMGLTIARAAPQTVRFGFTLLDEADPSREFCITLGAADAKEAAYEVLECRPPVPHIAGIVERLNADPQSPSALAEFVCAARRAFKEVVASGQAL